MAWGKDVVVFGVEISWSVHIDNKKKYILVLVEGLTQGLYDARITEAKYSIIMEATVFYLLMPQKYIKSKQETLT